MVMDQWIDVLLPLFANPQLAAYAAISCTVAFSLSLGIENRPKRFTLATLSALGIICNLAILVTSVIQELLR